MPCSKSVLLLLFFTWGSSGSNSDSINNKMELIINDTFKYFFQKNFKKFYHNFRYNNLGFGIIIPAALLRLVALLLCLLLDLLTLVTALLVFLTVLLVVSLFLLRFASYLSTR